MSRKMRPYHAGLLGADTLIVLDEAHLVPPFERLLEAIEQGTGQFAARAETDRRLIPPFKLLSLSATGRERLGSVFRLEGNFDDPIGQRGDLDDPVVEQRLKGRKAVTVVPADSEAIEKALAAQAWALADGGKRPVRCIVFCDKRDIAEKTKREIETLAKGDKKEGRPAVDIYAPELFVGARRVLERVDAAGKLKELGFIAGSDVTLAKPAFLIATSAGEVGVDLDADHMVCDLVAWERMVQRLGRVNRRGEGDAKIIVIVNPEPRPKKAVAEALTKKEESRDEEDRKAIASFEADREKSVALTRAFRSPFDEEPLLQPDGTIDASPGALRNLKMRAARDETVRKTIETATTPPPLRPALSRALVDAWSMTSLDEHTGRPEVEPWLRGWLNDIPQTTVAWRKHLPVRSGASASKKEVEDFFEAAPLHVSETLETESYRVMTWLQSRAAKLEEIPDDEKALKADDVVAFLLEVDGSLTRLLTLGDLLGESKDDKKRHEDIERNLSGRTLVMDARFGGLQVGMLKVETDDAPLTADGDEAWSTTGDKAWMKVDGGTKPIIRFRVLELGDESDAATEESWRENLGFDLERSADGEATRWLSVQKWSDTSNTENDRAEGRPQGLTEHQSWTAERARSIGERLGLPDDYVRALCMAARLHDEGKRAKPWQRAFHAERDKKKFGISDDLAKTRGPINQAVLGRYRHELGSLPRAAGDAELQRLPKELQALVLHLIAAHHGFARPLITTEGCEDAPPSALEGRAREVALRFARLQRRWGPWGLAWWESLLRAADAQASRANGERGD
ncbi:MAG: type I-U CRISPR-associated helicase/endonuclease Cas3 [Burkholderiales bacterium]|nr:MAG: type I-U CRISPR-associated helicase/endonuclease Cas3 [Burkholderiales bacterium]